ncbi:MAG: DNA mismatch repair endonuclease MutL [Bacteroidaceae bacterium]|nr:DNA mismatch repair endonuclease MutL [Bacteroidaceae bacterium]
MSDVIRLLPDSVANQIAAGEVIQRPSSVVKELVENAIDASATQIHVLITDAGRTCIQVIDDGVGMSPTDARLSFERHATSKICSAKDLFSLSTMGFRGEALASVAAVSQVELRTRTAAEEVGTLLIVSGSKVELQEATSCPVGTNFQVKNLFFNIPARRKFLKSDKTELSNIIRDFERIALVYPTISFTLRHNDLELFHLPASTLRNRIVSIFGKRLNQQLLPLEVDTALVKIRGYVAQPEYARKKGAHQYFFVNGRYMRHAYFNKAVSEAFSRLIAAGEFVSYFIYLEVDPSTIDVNIHPTKTEIKFENEQPIWQILMASIKESLGKFNAVPSIDFDTTDMPEIPAFTAHHEAVSPPEMEFNPNFNPFESAASFSDQSGTAVKKSDKVYESVAINRSRPLSPDNEPIMSEASYTEKEKSVRNYQYKGRYIISSVKSGLMLIDQHRAHVRVLFDKYFLQLEQKQGVSHGLLFPEIIQVPPSEAVILKQIEEELSAIGFDLSDLGGGSFSINAIPSGMEGVNPVNLIRDMLISTMEKGVEMVDEMRMPIALTLAKASAIVYGQVLSEMEMNNLVDTLFACSMPKYTPDGKTILAVIDETEIEKKF